MNVRLLMLREDPIGIRIIGLLIMLSGLCTKQQPNVKEICTEDKKILQILNHRMRFSFDIALKYTH